MWTMLWNLRRTCVFSVFMVSSLVATSQNSLSIFVTLLCEGSPWAVANNSQRQPGCLCELFSKWKPVTLLQRAMPLPAFLFNGDHATSTMLNCWSCSTAQTGPSESHARAFPRWQTWKTTSILSKPQRTQRRSTTPQGHYKHPPLLHLKQLALSNGYHSNADYTCPALNHPTINTLDTNGIWTSCQHLP